MNTIKLNLILLITLIYTDSLAQDYYVLQVIGSVKNNSGTLIKKNDQLSPTEQLYFSSEKDALAVVSPKTGRFIIKPNQDAKENEFMAILKDAISPAVNKLSTRKGGFNNVIDFQLHFQETNLLLDTSRLYIATSAFPMNDSSFFFMRYKYNEEEINKKLPFKDDILYIARASLFTIDGQPIDASQVTDLQLFHLNDGKPHFITPVDYSVPDFDTLNEEIAILKNTLSEKDYNVKDEAYLYLTEFYGNVDPEDFGKWYK